MKRLLILLTLLALLLTLPACRAKEEIIDDPGFETLEVHGKEDSVVEDDDWEGWDTELPTAPDFDQSPAQEPAASVTVTEDGEYTSRDEVALYLHTYGHLPSNFITKKDAQALGWEGGKLEPYAPGKSIGGDYFGNYEGLLPKKKGRKYFECDIDTRGAKSRGAKRIIWSNDGLIYYTDDHYESFELLYGEP